IKTFYFKDRMNTLFDEYDERVYNPIEGVLTEITDPNIVLETKTSRAASCQSYLASKPTKSSVYNTYTGKQREDLIDKMIENSEEK
ncbi:uncharacterized protein BX663DRAFT_423139, partial [Cokeromyces recurvatus]|uniref:uncharacterized protein n=1 Tax=Cokeromyces recurvatus TaxID=90255 RepID=UPI00221EE42C